MEKSQYTVKKIKSSEHNNFAQKDILGIHHVTAIASDPQKNIDFYTQVLGLRLVKLTVDFGDPRLQIIYILVTKQDLWLIDLLLERTHHVWKEGPIPIEHAIRGFSSVTL